MSCWGSGGSIYRGPRPDRRQRCAVGSGSQRERGGTPFDMLATLAAHGWCMRVGVRGRVLDGRC